MPSSFSVPIFALSLLIAPQSAPAATVESTAAAPQAEGSALEAFKERHETVVQLVQKRVKADQLQREVDLLLDYEWLAAAALGGNKRHEKRCAPRCDEFQTLLTRLIRENYLKRIRMAKKGSIEYVGEQKRPQASKVTTRIKYDREGRKQTLEVAYVMHFVDGRWQVRDIITDGVSLARNYKYEFNKILREQGIDGLISRLETKLNELAKND